MTGSWTNDAAGNITAPPEAGPGQARIVFGDDLPAALTAYTWPDGSTYVGAIILYTGFNSDDTNYNFIGFTKQPDGTAFPYYRVSIGQVENGALLIVDNGFGDLEPTGTEWQFQLGSANDAVAQSGLGRGWLYMLSTFGEARFEDWERDLRLGISRGLTDSVNIEALNGKDIRTRGPWKANVGGTPHILLAYEAQEAKANANTSVNAANTLIPGASITVQSAGPADIFEITATFAVTTLVAPTSQMSGNLQVDGAVQSGSVGPFRLFNNGEKVPGSRMWKITGLAAGAHTFRLSAAAGVAAQYQIASTDTVLNVQGYYGGDQ